MAYFIKDGEDIYCFCKNCYETAKEYLLFKLPPVSLKQIERFLHFSFKTAENFTDSNPHPSGKESWAKTRPPGSENLRIPRGRQGGWSGLKLTDT